MAIEITLSDLAFSARVFDAMTNYNEAYRTFREVTQGNLDLALRKHGIALMKWLNQWGCRQFATDQHDAALKNIAEWHNQVGHRLVDYDKETWQLDDHDLKVAEDVYPVLSQMTASKRATRNGLALVRVGPAGASKILFALRPRAYIPWDQAIRDSLRYGDDGAAYAAYLRDAKLALQALEESCVDNGFHLRDLPCQLGKPEATVPVLVNAYLWIVHSQGCKPPNRNDLCKWAEWSP